MDRKKELIPPDSAPEEIFRLIVRAYQERVVRFLSLFVRDTSECEELASDVFLALWANRDKLPGIESLDGYLFVIARNKALDHFRRNRPRTVDLDDLPIDLFHNTETTPESIYIDAELTERLNEAVESLPPQTKLAFMLVRENKMKYRDAAGILGVSVKTIEKQVASAVARLRGVLKK